MKYIFRNERTDNIVELDYPVGALSTDRNACEVDYKFDGCVVSLNIDDQWFSKDDLTDIIEVLEAMKEKLS